jgi:BirA family biotin operon repressor/biotin-[acetyl-CoA-carboxylase] ligase
MDEARLLSARGEAHGAVIAAGFQEAGRGRGLNRAWCAGRGENLLFTVLLRYPGFDAVPGALTLRAGLAVSLAVEDFAPELKGRVLVKWPNDLMLLETRAGADIAAKAAGVLAESAADASGCAVYIGVGVNLAQAEFPAAFRARATSLLLARRSLRAGGSGDGGKADACGGAGRFRLLEKILSRLYREIGGEDPRAGWRERLEERLYRRGERVRFFPGGAGAGQQAEGVLLGIGCGGELLLRLDGETESRAFVTGELDVYREDPA